MTQRLPENSSFMRELSKIITKNFWLKFLSLIFAIIIFLIVRADKEVAFERTAKIRIVAPPDMVVLGSKEVWLDLTVKQENSLFSNPPDDSELIGEVDISTEKAGHVRVKVTRENFPNLPQQYIVFISRPFIDVDIDKLQEKMFPVQPVFKGAPKDGIKIAKINVTPALVKVTGARQELSRIKNISTIPIDITGIDTNLTTNVSLNLDPDSTLTTKDKIVRVTILTSPAVGAH